MKVIVSSIIIKDNKILMVKEANKKCYGQWNYPGGHLEDFEKTLEGAIRETMEETGCQVKLTGVLPIINIDTKEETHILIRFIAEILEENISFNEEEILEVKWIDINDIKSMKRGELRGYDATLKTIFDNNKYHT